LIAYYFCKLQNCCIFVQQQNLAIYFEPSKLIKNI